MRERSWPPDSADRHPDQPGGVHSPGMQALAPGIPPLYHHIHEQLQAWNLPAHLAGLGMLIRRIERAALQPDQVAPLLGPEAITTAEALAVFGGAVPRPSLQNCDRTWKLFMLTYLHPPAAILKITELLIQLRHTQEADLSISTESISAAAHVCARLGMWRVRAELLDAQARLADPHLAARARAFLERSLPRRSQFFEMLRHKLAALLSEQHIAARIERRPRPVFQVIDDRLESAGAAYPWADVVVILIDNIHDCYRALGEINCALPVQGARLRDYIGGPKENGYQAIHTIVEYAPDPNERPTPVDIRIMTPAMDRYNQNGYLAYFAGLVAPARRPVWWDNPRRWQAAYQAQSAELFAFTPQGETIFLPHGATVLDFAVRVHSDLGVYCRGALVNTHRTSPGAQLVCGDICQVLIDEQGTAIDERLLDLASTTAAKARVRGALQKDHSGAMRGRQIFKDVLARRLEQQEIHASETTIEQLMTTLCQARGYWTVDAFYRAVARGEVAPDQVVRAIVEHLLLPRVDFAQVPHEVRARAKRRRLALCCCPRPSLPAVATVADRGHQLKVHVAGCPFALDPAYPLAWKPVEVSAYVADVLYESWDRPGLIHQVTGAVQQAGPVNIRSFSADVPEPSLARIRFSFEAPSKAHVEQVRQVLEHLPERRHVDLRTVTLIDEGFRIAGPLTNPYGPQPISSWPFFVGRDIEVRRIVAQLGSAGGANHILICGPKRIGKSSLLHHLSRYHLANFKVPSLLDLQSLPTEELRFARLIGRLSEMIAQQAGPRNQIAPLDPATIARDPIAHFGRFLDAIRDQEDQDRFVILIDELGVILSRLRANGDAQEFFDQWRALLSDERIYRHLSFVVALPDSSLARIDPDGDQPRIGELGLQVRLSVLDEHDARDLIATPVQMHLAYAAADLDLLLSETGGHPYYIHLICGQIITTVQAQQRRIGLRQHERQEIPADCVRDALDAVLSNTDAFHHTLADSSPATGAVLRATAALTSETRRRVRRPRLRTHLQRAIADSGDRTITRAVEERPDLLVETEEGIGIRGALVARWLRRHT